MLRECYQKFTSFNHQSAMGFSLSTFLLVSLAIVGFTSAKQIASINGGFTVELIHRDSPHSPLYNATETQYQRLANALRRSISRHRAANKASAGGSAEAPVYNNRGEYIMKMSLGTPPVPIMAIPDTGSDVIWTQCAPCMDCYQQAAPIFDPTKSVTYRKVACSTPLCSVSGRAFCTDGSATCQYSIKYGDGSHSIGDIAVDTVTLGSTAGRPVAFPKTVIGCGHDNAGNFDAKIAGIIGLGRGRESLVSQMGPIGRKFSYCLAPINSASIDSSKLNFGSNGIVSGAGVVSTPMYGSSDNTFYSLALNGISVGARRIEFQSPSKAAGGGNIIIDSGTTVTMLPSDLYSNFMTAVSEVIKLERVDDPNQFLELCYRSETDFIGAPAVTVHFEGADVMLSSTNTFVRVADDVLCFAFISIESGTPIYGNVAQANFLVGYDTQNGVVSFKRANCAAM